MQKIYFLLGKSESEFTLVDAQNLRKHVRDALNLIEKNEDQFKAYAGFAEFLQALSFQIRTQVEGMSILQEMGKHALENWCGETSQGPTTRVTAGNLANDIEKAFKNMPPTHWEGVFWNWLWWAITNPTEAFTAFCDNNIRGCYKNYNPYEQDNVDVSLGNYE